MKFMRKSLSAIALNLVVMTSFAVAPPYLITHNDTELASNAYIAGTIPSPYATPPHETRHVYWNMVRMACYGHTTNGKCVALVKIGTDTPNPIEIGYVSLDLETGEITPEKLSNNGYTIIVNGPGETTLTKDQ